MTAEPAEVFSFINRELPARVQRLTPRERVAFAVACAARLVRRRPPAAAALAERAIAAAWSAAQSELPDEAESLRRRLDELGEDLDEDATAASAYALRVVLRGNAQDAVWAAERCFDAAFSQAEDEVTTGWAVTKAVNDACAATPVVQQEYRRQIQDLTLLEQAGVTDQVLRTLKLE